MQILMKELQQNELWAIYLMGLDKDMPEKVTKANLTNIIRVLCKNLNWIEANQKNLLKDTYHEPNLYIDRKSDSGQPVDKVDYTPGEDNIAKTSHKGLSNAEFKSEPDMESTSTITPTEDIEQDPLDIFGTQSFNHTLCVILSKRSSN